MKTLKLHKDEKALRACDVMLGGAVADMLDAIGRNLTDYTLLTGKNGELFVYSNTDDCPEVVGLEVRRDVFTMAVACFAPGVCGVEEAKTELAKTVAAMRACADRIERFSKKNFP